MRNEPRQVRRTVACALGLLALMAGVPALAADNSRYALVTIHGRLTDPETGRAMAGATITFTSMDEPGQKSQGVTGEDGRFEVKGLTFASYAIVIETASGERIHGINTLPLKADKPVEVLLKISNRLESTTTVENQADRFVVAVEAPPQTDWKRFWKEFGAFFGTAASLGLVAL